MSTNHAQIVRFSRLTYDKGMVNAYEGNLSIRSGDRVLITPSAVCKGFLEEEMLIETDLQGTVLHARPPYTPSSEGKLHYACYRLRPDIGAVVHTHAPHATAFAVAGRAITTKAYPEMIVLYDQIPMLPYGTPSTDRIFNGLETIIHDYDIFLLENHGIVSVGKNLEEAYLRMESAECIARTLLLCELAGGPRDLPEGELKILRQMHTNLKRGN